MVDQTRQSDIVDEAFESMRLTPPAQGPSLQALEQTLQAMRQAQRKPRRISLTTLIALIERIKNMNKLIKYPIAAATVVAVMIVGWFVLGGGATLTLADVQAAVNKSTWIHLTFDNNNGGQIHEQWLNPSSGISFVKRIDGDIVSVDNVKNVRLWYRKKDNCINQNTPNIYPDGKVPEYRPMSAWEAVIGISGEVLEKSAKTAEDFWNSGVVEKQADGRNLVRFDSSYKDALGQFVTSRQIWIDPTTRLPVRVRERLQRGERKTPENEWITGTYDFPTQGPADLYALGVPGNTQIVKNDAKNLPTNVKELITKAAAARNAFPKCYRAVIWSNDNSDMIDVIYRNIDKYQSSRYFSLGAEYPKYNLAVPASADSVLSWVETQTPMSIVLFSDNMMYRRSNAYPADVRAVQTETTVALYGIRTAKEFFLTNRTPPVDEQWPIINLAGPIEIIKDSPEAPAGCITLSIKAGNYHSEYYLDPGKDFICVKSIHWRQEETGPRKDRETYLYNFTRTSDGHWYAGRKVLILYGDDAKNIIYSMSSWNIDVRVLKEDEFPPGTFDGEKLKQGAKLLMN